jgi:hypothetical protein
LALGADAVEEDGGRFVIRVLRDELAFESVFEDRLAEASGVEELGVDIGDTPIHGCQPFIEHQYDARLLLERRWYRHVDALDVLLVDLVDASRRASHILDLLSNHSSIPREPKVLGVESRILEARAY